MKKLAFCAVFVAIAAILVSCRNREALIRAPGSVEGQVVTIRTQAAGTLDVWRAMEGARLKRGEEIGRVNQDKILNAFAEIDPAEREISNQEERARHKLTSLRANVGYLRNQVERLERLREEAAVAGDQLDKTKLQLLEAEAGLFEVEKILSAFNIQRDALALKRHALELQLRDTVFLSPVEGPVLETFVTAGETLFPGAALTDVLDEKSLYVRVFLEGKEIGRLKAGDAVDILVDGRSGPPLRGTISFFGRKAEFSPKYILSEKEREALLYEVRVKPEDGRDALKVGMPVTVVFRPE